MRIPLLIVGCALLVIAPSLAGQSAERAADDSAIRALLQDGASRGTADLVTFTGADPRPISNGRFLDGTEAVPFPGANLGNRRNERVEMEVVRVDVANSGDLAYSLTNSILRYEIADRGVEVVVPRSSLAVWKKENGEWRVAASFMMPHDREPPAR
jgi:ketosteroid isomerase-like protein